MKKSSGIILFSHNDLNNTNMLFDEQSSKLFFIDYEYSGFNFRGFEFGNFFNELTMNYEVDQPPYFLFNAHKYPSVQLR